MCVYKLFTTCSVKLKPNRNNGAVSDSQVGQKWICSFFIAATNFCHWLICWIFSGFIVWSNINFLTFDVVSSNCLFYSPQPKDMQLITMQCSVTSAQIYTIFVIRLISLIVSTESIDIWSFKWCKKQKRFPAWNFYFLTNWIPLCFGLLALVTTKQIKTPTWDPTYFLNHSFIDQVNLKKPSD